MTTKLPIEALEDLHGYWIRRLQQRGYRAMGYRIVVSEVCNHGAVPLF
jgi:hypothetical protein